MDEQLTPNENLTRTPRHFALKIGGIIIILLAIIFSIIVIIAKKETSVPLVLPSQRETPTKPIIAEPLENETITISAITEQEFLRYGNKEEHPEPGTDVCKKDNFYLNEQCKETLLLPSHPEVTRQGSCLTFALETGIKKKVCDDPGVEAEDATTKYSFEEYVPGFGYVLSVALYEGNRQVLVNEVTGAVTGVFGKPIISPNGKRFLAVSVDMGEAMYNPNGFQIWNKNGDTYTLALEYLTKDNDRFGIINPVWVNENTIYFIKRELVGLDAQGAELMDFYGKITIEPSNVVIEEKGSIKVTDRYGRYVSEDCKVIEACTTISECVDKNTEEMGSICVVMPEGACYKNSALRCEKQANGHCGWTETTEFKACLKNPPPLEE